MKHRACLLVGAAWLAAALGGCGRRDAAVPAAPYEAPTLGEAWGKSLQALPDWSGSWVLAECDRPGTAAAVPGMDRGSLQFLIAPEQTLVVWDDLDLVRRLHTDGRGHPPVAALAAAPVGHSTGRWEGGTLQVETLLQAAGAEKRVTEQIRLEAPDRLVIDTRSAPDAPVVSRVFRPAAPGERRDCAARHGTIAR